MVNDLVRKATADSLLIDAGQHWDVALALEAAFCSATNGYRRGSICLKLESSKSTKILPFSLDKLNYLL